MTPDLKQKLGLSDVEEGMSKSLNLQKKMSILKKNSAVIMSSKKPSMREPKMELPLDSGQKNLKAKKSVMFNCTL
jgi:hypothetical protein